LCYESGVARDEDQQQVGFFVKNLESVQGDERNVVMFSTTFGRDSAGAFKRSSGRLIQMVVKKAQCCGYTPEKEGFHALTLVLRGLREIAGSV